MELFLLVAGSVGICYLQHRSHRKSVNQTRAIREGVETQFRQLDVRIGEEQYWLIGSEAQIVDDSEEGATINDTFRLSRIQRYARNRHGEYFLVILDGTSKPFIKHVRHNIAQIALGEKYLPPDYPLPNRAHGGSDPTASGASEPPSQPAEGNPFLPGAEQRRLPLHGKFLIVIFVAALAWCGHAIYDTYTLSQVALVTEGEVIESRMHGGLAIQFVAPDGRLVTFVRGWHPKGSRLHIGQRVSVAFDPRQVQCAVMADDFWSEAFAATVAVWVAGGFAYTATAQYRRARPGSSAS